MQADLQRKKEEADKAAYDLQKRKDDLDKTLAETKAKAELAAKGIKEFIGEAKPS